MSRRRRESSRAASPREASFLGPSGLVAERFELEGVPFIAFSWASAPDPSGLTPAERAVFDQLVSGLSNEAIAKARNASTRTIANQVASILRKLGVASRYELIARFAGLGPR